jgi:hypothetical protein
MGRGARFAALSKPTNESPARYPCFFIYRSLNGLKRPRQRTRRVLDDAASVEFRLVP